MACRASGLTNAELISNLFNSRLIKSPRVRDAMSSVDRAHYASNSPYEDSPQGIGFGATISAPHMQAFACESLLVKLIQHGFDGGHFHPMGADAGHRVVVMRERHDRVEAVRGLMWFAYLLFQRSGYWFDRGAGIYEGDALVVKHSK
jgi:protein-L-isoaspartate O-methyltransferase